MRTFVADFWSCLITGVILGGLGSGLLYFAIFTFSRIDIAPTLFAALGGACIAAAYVFLRLAVGVAAVGKM
jgi:hypothetical protein